MQTLGRAQTATETETASSESALVPSFQDAERLFAEQMCQGVHFVLQFLSKASSNQQHLYTEVR